MASNERIIKINSSVEAVGVDDGLGDGDGHGHGDDDGGGISDGDATRWRRRH